jgi:hypothetical protein
MYEELVDGKKRWPVFLFGRKIREHGKRLKTNKNLKIV